MCNKVDFSHRRSVTASQNSEPLPAKITGRQPFPFIAEPSCQPAPRNGRANQPLDKLRNQPAKVQGRSDNGVEE
jgi:hypothetical protein